MAVCLASLLFPPLICLPSGGSALENPPACLDRSHTSQNVEWLVQVGQHLALRMTGGVLSPLSATDRCFFIAHHFSASFWSKLQGWLRFLFLSGGHQRLPLHHSWFRNPNSHFWEPRLHQLPPFRFMHIFLKLQSVSFAKNSASLGPDPIWKRSIGLPRDDCGSLLFLTQIKQLDLFPITTGESVGASVKRFNAARSEAVVLRLLCPPS